MKLLATDVCGLPTNSPENPAGVHLVPRFGTGWTAGSILRDGHSCDEYSAATSPTFSPFSVPNPFARILVAYPNISLKRFGPIW
ncbi:hypothetical protein FKO01_51860 [Mesorhizobium sp. B2-3-3]|uniref:hypothetical protein n=1 Tax=Mesorhizobium sp. B2-4-15 TaxID=2589934 RepID=UPI0011538CE4|nr:hypothetical protein [Mesorhizobium sp. B2-4-15]TPK61174.1 hypothetical protein FJ930_28005 [Mesorhizobium sp. B2-4-15]TPM97575.1 hypothetical protein FKO01_51860 [Mesorhizobium sp. B2-3-3]